MRSAARARVDHINNRTKRDRPPPSTRTRPQYTQSYPTHTSFFRKALAFFTSRFSSSSSASRSRSRPLSLSSSRCGVGWKVRVGSFFPWVPGGGGARAAAYRERAAAAPKASQHKRWNRPTHTLRFFSLLCSFFPCLRCRPPSSSPDPSDGERAIAFASAGFLPARDGDGYVRASGLEWLRPAGL